MSTPAVAGMVYARANHGRWIADCPRPYCRSAAQLATWEQVFFCLDCHIEAAVIWPPSTEDIEQVLNMRPDPATRNWEPGEDLVDLLAENMAHGVTGIDLDAVTGTVPLAIAENGHIVSGAILAALRTGELGR